MHPPHRPRAVALARPRVALRVCAGVVSLCLTACAEPPTPPDVLRPVSSVELSVSADSLYPGDTVRLTARLLAADGTEVQGKVTWSSSSDIVTVSQDGLVRAVGGGYSVADPAYVRATSEAASDSAQIVLRPSPTSGRVGVSRVIRAGRSFPVRVYYLWDRIEYSAFRVSWSSSDTTVLAIARNGLATAKQPGTVLLTARTTQRVDTATVSVSSRGYKVHFLGTLGGTYSRALDLNDFGVVVGNSTNSSGDTVAFRWEAGSMRPLGPFRLPAGSALVDARGRVAGTADLLVPAGGVVTAVSDAGEVTGYWIRSGSAVPDSAFISRNGAVLRLSSTVQVGRVAPSTCNIDGPVPLARNDAGEVVGYGIYVPYPCAFSPGRGILVWSATGQLQASTSRGSHGARATAINAAGDYVGWTDCGGSFCFGGTSAFLRIAGHQGTALPGVRNRDSRYALDLNDKRQVVGFTSSGGALWEGGLLSDLSLLTADGDWIISEATGINERGQIVGSGHNARSGETGAVLLTPEP